MAKSGQKRAFEDETVQDRGPQLIPEPVDRRAIDYSAQIQTEAAGGGMSFLSPELWDTLSKLSAHVHDTRRKNWLIDQNNELDKYRINGEYQNKMNEEIQKREASLDATKFNMESYYDLQAKLEAGKRKGMNARGIVQRHYEDRRKLIDSQFYNSPYMYEQIAGANDKIYEKEILDAISYDYAATEARANYNMHRATSSMSGDMLTNPVTSVEDAMNSLGLMVGPQLKHTTDTKDLDTVNTMYNSILLAKATGLSLQAKLGNISPVDANNALLTLLSDYKEYTWNLKDTRGPGTEDKYLVTLDDDTAKHITVLIDGLQGGSRNKTERIINGEAYLTLVDYDNLRGWNSGSSLPANSYIYSRTPEQARDDFLKSVEPLLELAADDNASAISKLEKIYDAYFNYVLPHVAVNAAISAQRTAGADMGQVKKDWLDLATKIEDTMRTNPYATFPDLRVQNGKTVVDLNTPSASADPQLWEYISGKTAGNADPGIVNQVYYKHLVEAIRLHVEGDLVGRSINTDAEVNSRYNYVKSSFSADNLVLNTDKDEKRINEVAIPTLTENLRNWKASMESVSGGHLSDAPVMQLITDMVSENSHADDITKTLAYSAMGVAIMDAGLGDQLINMNMSSASSTVKEAANTMQLFGMLKLAGDTEYSANLRAYIASGYPLKGKSPKDADSLFVEDGSSILKGSNTQDGFEGYITKLLAKYNVPDDQWSSYRYALTNIALSQYYAQQSKAPGNAKRKDNYLDVDKVLDAGFMAKYMSKNGVLLNDPALSNSGTSASVLDKIVANTNHEIQMMKSVTGNDADLNVKTKGGKLYLYSGKNNLTLNGFGGGSRSGSMPIAIDVTNKPTGMSDQAYIDTVTNQVKFQFALNYISAPENSREVMRIIQRTDPKANPTEVYGQLRNQAVQLMNSANYTANQMGYVNYVHTNGQSEPGVKMEDTMLSKVLGEVAAISGFIIAPDMMHQGEAPGFVPTTGSFVGDAKTVLKAIKSGRAPMYYKGSGSTIASDARIYANYMTAYRPDKRGIKIADTTPVHRGDTANLGKDIASKGLSVRSTFRTQQSDPGIYKPGSKHSRGEAVDIGHANGFFAGCCVYNSATKRYDVRTDVLDNLVSLFGPQGAYYYVVDKIYFSLPSFWDKSDSRYAQYRNLRNSKGEKLFDKYPDHDDHFHVEFTEKISDAPFHFISTKTDKAKYFVEDAVSLVKNNSNITNISDSTSRTLATMWPTYKPTELDAKICDVKLSDLNGRGMNIVALARRYVALRDGAFGGRQDLAFMALCPGAKFVMKARDTGSPNPLKIPNKTYTAEELLKFVSTPNWRVMQSSVYFELVGNRTPYMNKVLNAGRKMGAI